MYIKLKIFPDTNTLQILEQVDTPPQTILYERNSTCIKHINAPELFCYEDCYKHVSFYLRGSRTDKDFTTCCYNNEEYLYIILEALSHIATVDIVWS